MKRIVITGIGLITPYGVGKDTFWQAMKEGKCALRKITTFDTERYNSHFAGEIANFDPKRYIDPMRLRRLDKISQLSIVGVKLAIEDAGLDKSNLPKEMGLIMGTAYGPVVSVEKFYNKLLISGPQYLNPMIFPNIVMNEGAGQASIEFKLKGYNSTLCTGFTSSANAVCYAFDLLKYKKANIILAGGVDEFCPSIFQAFYRKLLLSPNNNDIEICRPFDKNRNGLILSEGCGILVLETLEHALKRKTKIYAEIIGYGMSNSGKDINNLDARVESIAYSIKQVLKLNHSDEHQKVDYICSSANSSFMDELEVKGIKQVLGKYSYQIPVSAIKSMIGEIGGAFGTIGIASSCLALEDNIIPPTINYKNFDPNCDLYCVPNKSYKKDLNIILFNSLSIEGHNISILIKKL